MSIIFASNIRSITQYLMIPLSLIKMVFPTLARNYVHQTLRNRKIYNKYYSSINQQKIDLIDTPSFLKNDNLTYSLNLNEFQIQQEQSLDFQQNTTKSTCSSPLTQIHLQKNFIENRIKSLQYEANNPCEDTLSSCQLKSINAYTISIFDGHGGFELAQYSRNKINQFIDCFITQNLSKAKDISQVIKNSLLWSYQKIQDSFFEIFQNQIKLGNKKIKNVGTCGITAIIHNDKVYIGNAGDSQAIFILKEDNHIKNIIGNQRLSVNNRKQRERLKQKWNGIDDQIIIEESNNVFYLKGRLQPTYSIGDYYLKKQKYYNGSDCFKGPYLSCVPEISQHQLTKSHKFMVIASDGVWDAIPRKQVMDALMSEAEIDLSQTCYDLQDEQHPPFINNVLNRVLESASQTSGMSINTLKSLQKGERRSYHDDITLAVINLQKQF